MPQATAGEEEDSEEEGDEDKDVNIEKEKAYLMHATSGSGMQAIEVQHSGYRCRVCSRTDMCYHQKCLTHAPWLRQLHACQAKHAIGDYASDLS